MFLGIGLGLNYSTLASRGFSIFVDSVSGNDANDGASEVEAVATLSEAASRLAALGDNRGLALVRGSYWREQFDIPIDGLRIGVVGNPADPMPVIDGADVATGWTEHEDGETYPDVWQLSWTRSTAATGQDYLGLWADEVRPRAASSLADLQANGGWMPANFTATTTTVYIKSAADPNTSGVVYEITKRSHAFNGHTQILGSTRTGQNLSGPIELKRCVGHYNALSLGPGTARRMFIRDGNIHHSVSEGDQVDILATECSPSISPSMAVFFRAESEGFAVSCDRGLCLLPGGSDRPDTSASAFYAHGSSGKVDSLSVRGALTRGVNFANADAEVLNVLNSYCEDCPTIGIALSATVTNVERFLLQETVASPFTDNNGAIVGFGATQLSATQSAFVNRKGGVLVKHDVTHPSTYLHCAVVSLAPSFAITDGSPEVNYCVTQGLRCYQNFVSGYAGDFNVFYRNQVGETNPLIHYEGVLHGSLSAFQSASGQDANSVYLKHADQVSGNGIAFWLGVATGASDGPSDGDFRINPSARVYNGAGAQLSGVFADGVTPITMAGPQEHWDFNQRAVVSGSPSRWPMLPADIAEMRAYIDNPTAWDFYP
jgi:hypothetical protein